MPSSLESRNRQHTADGHRRRVAIALLAALVVLPLAGCGKKGDPEPPDGDSQFPRTYPTQ